MPFSLTRRDASAHVSWLARGSLCALALFCLSTARAVEPSKLSASLASTTVGTFNVKLSPVLLSGIGSAVFANTPVSGGVSLYRVSHVGIPSAPSLISGTAAGVSVTDYKFAPDGFRLIFQATNAQYRPLFATTVSGPTSVSVGGLPPGVSGPFQWVDEFKISSDSTRVVFRARQIATATNSPYDLWSAPVSGGGPVTLLMAGSTTVNRPGVERDFQITSDSSRVVFRNNSNLSPTRVELYSVQIDGSSAATRLSAPPAFGSTHQVQDFALSPNGVRVVFRSDEASAGLPQLYSVPTSGGAITALPGASVAGRQVYPDYQVSSDSVRVVFKADREALNVHDLYSVPIAGGTPTPVSFTSSSILAGGVIRQFAITPDAARVVYVGNKSLFSNYLLYSVPITGGSTGSIGTFWGDVGGFKLSADSARVVFTGVADGSTPNPSRLWGVAAAGGVPVALSGPVAVREARTTFEITPNSERVVFSDEKHGSSSTTGAPTIDIYSVPIGGGIPTLISGTLVSGGSVFDPGLSASNYVFQIGPDSKRIAFVSTKNAVGVYETFSAPIDGGGMLLDIDGERRVLGVTDALMLMRRALGLPAASATTAAVATGARRTSATAIGAYLDAVRAADGGLLLDIDGNGTVDASTDLMLLMRYTLGFRGDTLVNGALGPVGAGAGRRTAALIEDYLDHLMERSAVLSDLVAF